MHWRRKWQPTPVFLPEESQGQGTLVDCRLMGSHSQTRLKRLSSSRWVALLPWGPRDHGVMDLLAVSEAPHMLTAQGPRILLRACQGNILLLLEM